MRAMLMAGAAALALAACQATGAPPSSGTASIEAAKAAPKPELGTWGVDKTAMKTSVKPGDDFFSYVNGAWLDTFEIPADKTNYGSFTVLADRSEERVRKIIEDAAAKSGAPGSVEQKIGDLYASFMDEAAVEAKGLAPLQGDLDAIAAAKTRADIATLMARPDISSNAIVRLFVDVDSKNTERYIVYATHSGIGLPDRDYYLVDNERFVKIRAAYKDFIAQMLTLGGVADAKAKAEKIYALEKKIAEAHWERTKRRDRDLTYNLMSVKELEAYAPGFPWASGMEVSGLGGQTEVVLREKDAFPKLAKLFADTPVDTWKAYLTFHALQNNASNLPKAFDDANFNFFGKTLSGQKEQRERWKRGVSLVNGALGEAVGQVYVEKYFPAESKAKMEELVANVKAAFAKRIDGLDWMTEETKKEARVKLASFTTKIGYPDKWKDYSALTVERGDLLGNVERAGLWRWNENISKLGKPIDRTEWFMNPQTVNAYYSPPRNEIVFPAAILQAPFFDPGADDAVNYGGIGAVIGHELGHGFDDQGRKSDGKGMLRDWWTKADADAFKARADRLGAQYDAYEPAPGHKVKGAFTMGENIGDLGGLTVAYEAYRLSLGGKEAPVVDGLSGDQRFFLAWGQIWRRKYREEDLINRLSTDPHSPSQYRSNGVVRNMDAWYAAFDVKPGDALYLAPEERVRIW